MVSSTDVERWQGAGGTVEEKAIGKRVNKTWVSADGTPAHNRSNGKTPLHMFKTPFLAVVTSCQRLGVAAIHLHNSHLPALWLSPGKRFKTWKDAAAFLEKTQAVKVATKGAAPACIELNMLWSVLESSAFLVGWCQSVIR